MISQSSSESVSDVSLVNVSENIYVHFVSGLGSRLIHVEEVVEVIPMVMLDESGTDSSNSLRGLFNYRGKIIPVFDICSDAVKTTLGADKFLIVTCVDDRSLAVVASEVNQLVSVELSDISHITPVGESSFLVAKVNDLMIRIINTADFLGVTTNE